MRTMLFAVLSGTGLIMFQPAIGTEHEIRRESLRPLTGVHVVLAGVDDVLDGHVVGSDLATRLELRLRRSGVPVLAKTDLKKVESPASLSLGVNALPVNDERLSFALAIQLNLNQLAVIGSEETGLQAVEAETWRTSRLAIFGLTTIREGAVNDAVDAMADEFINAWLASHPPSPAGSSKSSKP